MSETAQISIPPRLMAELEDYVREGWARDVNTLVVEAVRRFLESHHKALAQSFIRDDVEWGLHGQD